MVSSWQRLHWLVIGAPLALGVSRPANADAIKTQLPDRGDTFSRTSFGNAFIDRERLWIVRPPTRQSTNGVSVQYRCGAVDEGSSANTRHTKI